MSVDVSPTKLIKKESEETSFANEKLKKHIK
jgi:hypothetical protein